MPIAFANFTVDFSLLFVLSPCTVFYRHCWLGDRTSSKILRTGNRQRFFGKGTVVPEVIVFHLLRGLTLLVLVLLVLLLLLILPFDCY